MSTPTASDDEGAESDDSDPVGPEEGLERLPSEEEFEAEFE